MLFQIYLEIVHYCFSAVFRNPTFAGRMRPSVALYAAGNILQGK